MRQAGSNRVTRDTLEDEYQGSGGIELCALHRKTKERSDGAEFIVGKWYERLQEAKRDNI